MGEGAKGRGPFPPLPALPPEKITKDNMSPLPCFKAYDVRGRVPDELNAELATAIARALVDKYRPEMVVVGRDARESNVEMFEAVTAGLTSMGADVVDVGQVTTPVFYFSAGRGQFPLGVMITASHNPREYNGLKLVRSGTFPIGGLRTEPVYAYGGSARVVFHQGIPIGLSSDFRLYRNDPDAEASIARREDYVPGRLSWFARCWPMRPLCLPVIG